MNAADFIAAGCALQIADGLSEGNALNYMKRIGDTPEIDDAGKAIIRDDSGREIARVIWPDEHEHDDAQ